MRVFVTGATGFIGSAVACELIGAGHQVVGLARSDKAAEALLAAGAQVHRGSLEEVDSLRSGAANADGVIHLGFSNDFSNLASACEKDCIAIKTLGEALKGSNRPLVTTSVITLLKSGCIGTEKDETDPNSVGAPRIASEEAALSFADKGVRVSVVRLAPCVHDENRQGFATALTYIAREKGISAYVGDGLNRWPAIHRLDAAKLFRMALEAAPAGSCLHGVGEEGIHFKDIAETIGHRLNLPVESISKEAIDKHFGWLAQFTISDNPTSNALTQKWLGWKPEGPALISDLERK
ncbi:MULTISPECIES: SDR family oxidoreductase [unclassified Clostridium]|uniref:SDR family oxidoreductase n=1 Tax=unclassified Clostridium TaxID=2614128 RepID=UPI000297423D|nr:MULTISPECIES: SDR family oxidoreductase [unclassified Clostridium]EKQ54742.1 MAG: nucleoside-diphosphate-sugar epimerase [Clostridium sp. Maddingley MBC34-26]